MSGLAQLLTDCEARGIRLLPAGDGGLTIDAPQGALTAEQIARLKAFKRELLALLRPAADAKPAQSASASDSTKVSAGRGLCENHDLAPPAATENPPAERAAAVCRCGATTWRDVPIHGGRSIRRDCARCGRFIDFPIWYGMEEG
ncbi:MAG TPA: hypothetical protein VMV10_08220 [Pirellulales bacterium]|nr:hypothetical protein [Pirellulales bacterium]